MRRTGYGEARALDKNKERPLSIRLGYFYPNARSVHALSVAVAARNGDIGDLETHVAMARAAEEVGFDYLFMMDAWAPFGPESTAGKVMNPMLLAPIRAAAMFSATRRIRFITTIHTSWFHPLQVARIDAALDTLSGGRWGMNIVSGDGFAKGVEGAPPNALDHDARYGRAAETVEVLTQAWSTGRVDFAGEHFTIRGEIIGPGTVQQPRPYLVGAGASEAGIGFSGRYADLVFIPGRTPPADCRQRLDAIRATASDCGRPAGSVAMQMHASVIVRETAVEAESQRLEEAIDLAMVAEYLNTVRGSISSYDDI